VGNRVWYVETYAEFLNIPVIFLRRQSRKMVIGWLCGIRYCSSQNASLRQAPASAVHPPQCYGGREAGYGEGGQGKLNSAQVYARSGYFPHTVSNPDSPEEMHDYHDFNYGIGFFFIYPSDKYTQKTYICRTKSLMVTVRVAQ
jgi:hypothetical protein